MCPCWNTGGFSKNRKYIQVIKLSVSIRDDRIVLILVKYGRRLVIKVGKKGMDRSHSSNHFIYSENFAVTSWH